MTSTVRFSVSLPSDWRQIDLHPETRDQSCRELVREMVAAMPDLAPRADDITAYTRNLTDKAWRVGTKFCSVCAIPMEEGVLLASLTATALPRPASNTELSSVEWLSQSLPDPQWVQDGDWLQTVPVSLPSGHDAVRRFGVASQELEPHTPLVRAVIMETYIPTPTGTLMIGATSPAISMTDEILELFDILTQRFEVL
ncbi:hypothetical protein FYJ24_07385 [Actinomycetaceae bacterium WB03_NA08]|uniref:Uncharacterized protein n=1 Tax=Scrofimicrobium canadense TaxID=2652290 RepID=A0A6N7VS26_9ACTO|nr:hypothetical protein [Scrofimicrobium canadense]MSS84587.1 hypothetical protein [Scrofimicrobium canadense]